jgi:hypothetical protein
MQCIDIFSRHFAFHGKIKALMPGGHIKIPVGMYLLKFKKAIVSAPYKM